MTGALAQWRTPLKNPPEPEQAARSRHASRVSLALAFGRLGLALAISVKQSTGQAADKQVARHSLNLAQPQVGQVEQPTETLCSLAP